MSYVSPNGAVISKWRRAALPISIILNVFLVAVFAGHFLPGPMAGNGAGPPQFARALSQAISSLPSRDADAFRTVLKQDASHYVPEAMQLAKARIALEQSVTADPFDPAAARQALAVWQVRWNDFMNGFSPALIDALAKISLDGRRKLVAERRLAQPGPRLP